MGWHGWGLAAVCAAGLVGGPLAEAADDPADAAVAALARTLVERRAAVDALATQVADQKQAASEQVRSLTGQQGDLERLLKPLEVQLADLDARIAEQEAAIAKKTEAKASLRPLVARELAALRECVARGLPFKRVERLLDLDRLAATLERGDAPADQVLARLWSATEDEIRLGRENGLYQGQVTLDGTTQLADLLRVGLVACYFRAADGRVGIVATEGETIATRVVTDAAAVAALREVFDAFGKRIRQGFFVLPHPEAR